MSVSTLMIGSIVMTILGNLTGIDYLISNAILLMWIGFAVAAYNKRVELAIRRVSQRENKNG